MGNILKNRAEFPVLQSTHRRRFFHLLGAHKNDVLVFDRCGRLAFHLLRSQSSVKSGFVESSILATYFEQPCGLCDGLVAEELTSASKNAVCRCVPSNGLNQSCSCLTNGDDHESCLCQHSPVDFRGRCSCPDTQKSTLGKRCQCRHSKQSLKDLCKCRSVNCSARPIPLASAVAPVSSSSESSIFGFLKSYFYNRFKSMYNFFSSTEPKQ